MPMMTLRAARGMAGPPTAALSLPYIAAGKTPRALVAACKIAQGASMSLLVQEIPRHSEPVEETTNSQAWASPEISAAKTSQCKAGSHLSPWSNGSPRCPLEIERNTAQ